MFSQEYNPAFGYIDGWVLLDLDTHSGAVQDFDYVEGTIRFNFTDTQTVIEQDPPPPPPEITLEPPAWLLFGAGLLLFVGVDRRSRVSRD